MDSKALKEMVSSCIASQISLSFVGEEGVTVTTPFIDRHRDYICVNVTCRDGEYRIFEEDVAVELGKEIPEWAAPMLNGNTCEITEEGITYKCHEFDLVGIGVQEVGQCAAQISAGLAVAAYMKDQDLEKHLLDLANAMYRTVDAYHTLIRYEQDMTKARKDDLDSRLNVTKGWWRVLAAGLTDEDCTHTSPYRIDKIK